MKRFIVVSTGDYGYTEDCCGQGTNNIQVLDIIDAHTIEAAMNEYEKQHSPFVLKPVRIFGNMEKPFPEYEIYEIVGKGVTVIAPEGDRSMWACEKCLKHFWYAHNCEEHQRTECPYCFSDQIVGVRKGGEE